MIFKHKSIKALNVIIILVLTACNSQNLDSSINTPSGLVTVDSTRIFSLTDLPTLVVTQSGSDFAVAPTVQSPLDFSASNIGIDYLFGGETERCLLPCWYGLNAGVSALSDVQNVNDEIFALAGINIESFRITTRVLHYSWALDGDNMSHLSLDIVFDASNQELDRLEFYGDGAFTEEYALSRIINMRGLPELMYFRVRDTQVSTVKEPELFLIYEDGLIFNLKYMQDYCSLNTECQDEIPLIEFCSDTQPSRISIILNEPSSSDVVEFLDSNSAIENDGFITFDEVLGTELSLFLQENQNGIFCVPINLPLRSDN